MTSRLSKKNELPLGSIIGFAIRELGLAPELNIRRIFAAWDEVSGAKNYTVSKYVRDGVLYCSIGSSVVRNRLYPRKAEILEKINSVLENDELFTKNLPWYKASKAEGTQVKYVKELVLR